jgi:hypothetical protein
MFPVREIVENWPQIRKFLAVKYADSDKGSTFGLLNTLLMASHYSNVQILTQVLNADLCLGQVHQIIFLLIYFK